MANNINGYGGNAGNNKSSNRPGSTGNPVESAELTADDYEIIAAGLGALGEFLLSWHSSKPSRLQRKLAGRSI